MKALTLLVSFGVAVLSLVQLPAATARMPLSEVHAGMHAVGVTVFEGAALEEFDAHILGVLTNVMGPQRNLIVARLSGGPLAETGVIQGMSGSPIYIDDRLVGAVSYSLGSFSKDAIAGITPIDEMIGTDAAAGHTLAYTRRRSLDLDGFGPGVPAMTDALTMTARAVFGGSHPFATRPTDIHALGLPPGDAARLGMQLQPIATPLLLSGAVPEVHQFFAAASGSSGFVTTVGGTMSAEAKQELSGRPLRPGDPVGASLVRGDLTMAGTGTVTLVEDGRVYAFGHPFYNVGPASFPMTQAHVTTVLPSLAISSKIAAIGDVIGTFDQDRATGIFGSLGTGPDLIPIRVTLQDAGGAFERAFSFDIVDDPVFTPLLTATALLNTLFTMTREVGPRTFVLDGSIHLEGRPNVRIGNIYTGDIATIAAATSLTTPLNTLLRNTFESVSVDAIEVDITAVEEPRTATLERVWVDAVRPRPGDQVPLRLSLRNYRGVELLETVLLDIPPHVSGSVTVEVLDAAAVNRSEQQMGHNAAAATTLDQIIRSLNRLHQNNRLYVRLRRSGTGVVYGGEAMPALPGSVLAVLEANGSSGALTRLTDAPLGEWEVVTDHAVSGSRQLTIELSY